MIARTWPYGTIKQVTVEKVIRSARCTAIICTDGNDSREGYVCLFRPDQVAANEGERGILIFTQGGPTGGYWKYSAAFKDVDAKVIHG